MELDELKSRWVELERRLAATQDLNHRLLTSIKQDKLRSACRRILRMPNTELVAALACLFFLVGFITQHRHQASAVLTGLSLTAFLIGTAIGNLCENIIVYNIDFDLPVLAIQRKLLDLKTFRLHLFQLKFLLGMLLWPLFIIVLIEEFFHVDPYAYGGGSWLEIMTLSNLVMIGMLVLVAPRLPRRRRGSSAWGRCIDAISGTELARTTAYLQEISSFEGE